MLEISIILVQDLCPLITEIAHMIQFSSQSNSFLAKLSCSLGVL